MPRMKQLKENTVGFSHSTERNWGVKSLLTQAAVTWCLLKLNRGSEQGREQPSVSSTENATVMGSFADSVCREGSPCSCSPTGTEPFNPECGYPILTL